MADELSILEASAALMRAASQGEYVHAYLISTQKHLTSLEVYAPLLDAREISRAKAYQFPRDKNNYIITHGLLRKILGAYLNIAPEEVNYQYNDFGKPFLPEVLNPDHLQFNLSHSQDYALVAISRDRMIGADIEYIHATRDIHGIVHRFFSNAEITQYEALPSTERLPGFYRAWTRKEALVKAIGKGLAHSLSDFSVSFAEESTETLQTTEPPAQWTLYGFKPLPQYFAAIAWENLPEKSSKILLLNEL
jgi:4'-phosphopantetheinyl transferase